MLQECGGSIPEIPEPQVHTTTEAKVVRCQETQDLPAAKRESPTLWRRFWDQGFRTDPLVLHCLQAVRRFRLRLVTTHRSTQTNQINPE